MLYILRYTLENKKVEHLFEELEALHGFYIHSRQYRHRKDYQAFEVNLDEVTIKQLKL